MLQHINYPLFPFILMYFHNFFQLYPNSNICYTCLLKTKTVLYAIKCFCAYLSNCLLERWIELNYNLLKIVTVLDEYLQLTAFWKYPRWLPPTIDLKAQNCYLTQSALLILGYILLW